MILREEEKLYAKLQWRGMDALTDVEVLANVMGGNNHNSLEIARALLDAFGNLSAISRASESALRQVAGIGEATAIRILCAFEIGARMKYEDVAGLKIRGSETAARILINSIGNRPEEHFVSMYVNRNHEVVKKSRQFKGGISATVIDPRVIIKEGLLLECSAIIVGHNHPSGALKPSEADIRITRKIAEGCKLMDILLLDNIIVSPRGYYSFADEGML